VYHIGKFEVTNYQYAHFLNAVAATDDVALFDVQMESSPHGGITRSGAGGSFHYEVKPGAANKPVNFVSWYDAARFANWLHNGAGSADTEDGAYTLPGGTPIPDNEARIRRNAGAQWFIPSESEWHKAAYFNAGTSSYYDYPTGSDSSPIAEAPPGGANSGNFQNVVGTVTDVGAYPITRSPYGTFDQAGNLWEWNESVYFASDRGHRGGSWTSLDSSQVSLANLEWALGASIEREITGFRIATVVPEPTSMALAALTLIGTAAASLRQKR
jgi:formylglycine-generating enzyme required for sulfatase activity